MQVLTLQQLKSRLQEWSRLHLDLARMHLASDEVLIDRINQIVRDICIDARLHRERYRKKCTSGETNYKMAGRIDKVLHVIYEDSGYRLQYYAAIEDTIVLQIAPNGDPYLQVHYIRDPEDIQYTSDGSDAIDLPSYLLRDFEDLLKTRYRVDYGEGQEAEYLAHLAAVREKAVTRGGTNSTNDLGVIYGDGRRYHITRNRVSAEHVIQNAEGDYVIDAE